jgi:hypothetical protein
MQEYNFTEKGLLLFCASFLCFGFYYEINFFVNVPGGMLMGMSMCNFMFARLEYLEKKK